MAKDFIEIHHNLDEIREQITELEQKLVNVIREVVDRHLDKIVTEAKRNAPVDTGFLRDNITSLGAKIGRDVINGEVLSAAEYSSYVHDGTRYIEPNPFLDDAIEELEGELIKTLKRELDILMETTL